MRKSIILDYLLKFELKLKKYFGQNKKPRGQTNNPKGGNGRLRIFNDSNVL